jgi:hypothetical protein
MARKVIGWTAHHAGRFTGQVRDSIEEAQRVARERYQRGRDEPRLAAEIPPASSNGATPPSSNGSSTNGTAHANPPPSVREKTPAASPGE